MSAFQKKKLDAPARVCLRLKEARQSAGISLETLSAQTKISKKYLLALEDCRFDEIPYGPTYQKHFIRSYAEALELPADAILAQFVAEEDMTEPINAKPYTVSKQWFRNIPGVIKNAGIAVGVVATVAYLGWQINSMITPPELFVYSPVDGYVTASPIIMIHGQTSAIARVYLNGQELPTNGSGRFEQELTLSPGINAISLSAQKRHGKKTELTRHVIVKTTDKFSLRADASGGG